MNELRKDVFSTNLSLRNSAPEAHVLLGLWNVTHLEIKLISFDKKPIENNAECNNMMNRVMQFFFYLD